MDQIVPHIHVPVYNANHPAVNGIMYQQTLPIIQTIQRPMMAITSELPPLANPFGLLATEQFPGLSMLFDNLLLYRFRYIIKRSFNPSKPCLFSCKYSINTKSTRHAINLSKNK